MQNSEIELKKLWKIEEDSQLTGWDFSRIADFHQSGIVMWDYQKIVHKYLDQKDQLLDMGTADGNFLKGLKHPYYLTSVTEAYPPNIELCQRELSPLGITVYPVSADEQLPILADSFDCVINRHEAYDVSEVTRVLRAGGVFITQQVGGLNHSEIAQYILPNQLRDLNQENFLSKKVQEIEAAGFTVELGFEEFPFTTFKSVAAFVYFAKRIEWEFPDFSVETSFSQLIKLHKIIERQGFFVVKEV